MCRPWLVRTTDHRPVTHTEQIHDWQQDKSSRHAVDARRCVRLCRGHPIAPPQIDEHRRVLPVSSVRGHTSRTAYQGDPSGNEDPSCGVRASDGRCRTSSVLPCAVSGAPRTLTHNLSTLSSGRIQHLAASASTSAALLAPESQPGVCTVSCNAPWPRRTEGLLHDWSDEC